MRVSHQPRGKPENLVVRAFFPTPVIGFGCGGIKQKEIFVEFFLAVAVNP
jgi:hypothetical protein